MIAVVVGVHQQMNGDIGCFFQGVDQVLRLLRKLRIYHNPAFFGPEVGNGSAFFGKYPNRVADHLHLVWVVGSQLGKKGVVNQRYTAQGQC